MDLRAVRVWQKSGLGFLGILLLALTACEPKKKNNDISEPPLRSGLLLEPLIGKYSDYAPSLSADGTKLVFLSGRESEADQASLKVFKADWPAGAAPAAPTRLTSKDIGSESEAVLSPDGEWVLIGAVTAAGVGVYLQDYASSAEPFAIVAEGKSISQLKFSPDSRLAAWIERGEDASGVATSQLVLFDLADAAVTTGAHADPQKLDASKKYVSSAEGELVYDFSFSADATAGAYGLVVGVMSKGQLTYSKRVFATADLAAAASTSAWGQAFVPARGGGLRLSTSQGVAMRKLVPNSNKVVERAGDFEEETKLKSVLLSEPVFMQATSGESKVLSADAVGYEVLSVDAFSDGATLITSRSAIRCQDPNEGLLYVSGMAIIANDLSGFTRLIPQLGIGGKNFHPIDSYCKRRMEDEKKSEVHSDYRVEAAYLAGQAKQTDYRLAYVTRFSPAFDDRCFLKVGDTEVYLLEVKGEAKTIYPLSQNAADIKSDSRGDKEACTL